MLSIFPHAVAVAVQAIVREGEEQGSEAKAIEGAEEAAKSR